MSNQPIPYPDLDTLPASLRDAVTSRASLNIYRMIAHSPGLAPSFYTMANDMFVANSLPPDWRELAILRVGYQYGAVYEVHHHSVIGKAVGMSETALAAAQSGDTASLTEQEAVILRLTDRLLAEHTLTDSARALALSVLTVNQLTDLVLTVGFYQLVCNFLNTFNVLPEDSDAAS
jgi:4-carboxymuconolactone decarboxylase